MYASVTSVPHLLALASSEEQITSRWTVVVFLKEKIKEKINHYKKYAVNIHKNSKRENVAEIDITVFQKYIIIYTPLPVCGTFDAKPLFSIFCLPVIRTC